MYLLIILNKTHVQFLLKSSLVFNINNICDLDVDKSTKGSNSKSTQCRVKILLNCTSEVKYPTNLKVQINKGQ